LTNPSPLEAIDEALLGRVGNFDPSVGFEIAVAAVFGGSGLLLEAENAVFLSGVPRFNRGVLEEGLLLKADAEPDRDPRKLEVDDRSGGVTYADDAGVLSALRGPVAGVLKAGVLLDKVAGVLTALDGV
jgi:hypothetical protein